MARAVVVVPCYNEAKRLNMRAIQDFGRRAESIELLFVNDGSRDETLELLEHLHQCNPRRFSFLHLAKNVGKAEAVRQGVLTGIRSGADYVGFWDADLATPLSDIESFCRVLDANPRIEAVIGTRIALLGHKIDRRPVRRLLGRVFARTASLALGVRIFDTQCGAKLFRATPRLAQLFAQPFLTRWIFDVEVFARMRQLHRATMLPSLDEIIYEFPLDSWRDVAGSSLKKGDFVRAVVEMVAIYWTYLRRGARLAVATQLPPSAGRPDHSDRSKRGDQRAA
jgi:glycosyltransferase involved in cell wall biosynthesis